MKKVVVTGLGVVSPLGHTVNEFWRCLLSHTSGIHSFIDDPILKNPTAYNLALIRDFPFKSWRVPHISNRANSFLMCAAEQALVQSALTPDTYESRQRIGVCMGVLSSNISTLSQQIEQSHAHNYKTVNRLSMLQILSNMATAGLVVKYKLNGPSMTVNTACASGLSSVVEGCKWIQLNEADVVLVGGTEDDYNALSLQSSVRMQAMTTATYNSPSEASRPFDTQRSGFVLGEGAGVMIIESQQHARERKAHILAEIGGYAYNSDGYHLVRPAEEGVMQRKAMEEAVRRSGLRVEDIDVVSAHATSTKAGDQIQANAIKCMFGEYKPFISAIKSNIGHTFAAAGTIESIAAIMSLQQGVVPKILNLQTQEVQGLNYCKQNKTMQIQNILKNSFGFGGINVSVVYKKYS